MILTVALVVAGGSTLLMLSTRLLQQLPQMLLKLNPEQRLKSWQMQLNPLKLLMAV
jgi:hypothetical protein